MNLAALRVYALFPLQFVWQNVPTLKETVIYSSIQSFIEIILDLDKVFGPNPAGKAIIRDFAKVPGEVPLAYAYDPYGSTANWHDSFSLGSAIQKPVLKIATIVGYKQFYDSEIEINVHKFNESLQQYFRLHNQSLAITNKTLSLLQDHMSAGLIEKGSRFSNIIGEPVARGMDGCAKKRQEDMISEFISQDASSYGTKFTKYSDIVKDPDAVGRFSTYKRDNDLGLLGVPGYVISKEGLQQIPYAGINALLKSTAIDMLGKIWIWKSTKEWLVASREYVDGGLLLYMEGISDVKKQSFYTRASNIWNLDFYKKLGAIFKPLSELSIESLSKSWNATSTFAEELWAQEGFARKSTSTIATFSLELTEKTWANMFTMYGLSTPNKALGNFLRDLNKFAPITFNVVGLSFGLYYVWTEFFDKDADVSKTGGIPVPKTATQEEKCYISFINSVLKENDGALPSTYADTDANGERIEELLSCIGKIDASEDLAHLHIHS